MQLSIWRGMDLYRLNKNNVCEELDSVGLVGGVRLNERPKVEIETSR